MQHFKETISWDNRTINEKLERDFYKMTEARNHGYTIIRIFQEDIKQNKNNWFEQLSSHLYFHESPEEIYISSTNYYNIFKYKLLSKSDSENILELSNLIDITEKWIMENKPNKKTDGEWYEDYENYMKYRNMEQLSIKEFRRILWNNNKFEFIKGENDKLIKLSK